MDILRKGNKDLIKDINRYTVLNLIREKGEITRTEIAKKCDFGMSTLTYILDDLQQKALFWKVPKHHLLEAGVPS